MRLTLRWKQSASQAACVAVLAVLAAGIGTVAGEDVPVDYRRQIRPILNRCVACHGALAQQAGLRLDTAALAMAGGDSGPAIVPNRSAESLLIHAVTGTGGMTLMPQEGRPLSSDEIGLLAKWIDEGAPTPADEPIPVDPRQHWSFVPPVRPELPSGEGHPLDRLLAADHARQGLTPLGPAEKHVEFRRVYLDLIGIPPTRQELVDYLSDTSPGAYERVVDRLLASPLYGQRWARHWMDIWRYSDWDGHGAEVRESKPHIWRWRDWIVDALNADAPYDGMVREMLAGDELAPEDPHSLAATGYLVRNWHRFNRNTWLDATVEHTCKAFLGLTINCARCHDHKYDPLLQEDYYRLRAVFEPYQVRIEPVGGELNLDRNGLARAYDADIHAPTYRYARGDETQPDKEHPVSAGWPRLFGGELVARPVSLAPLAYYPGLHRDVQLAHRSRARAELQAAEAELQSLASAPPGAAPPPSAAVLAAQRAAAEAKVAARAAALAACEARIAADEAQVAPPAPGAQLAAAANLAERLERHAAARTKLLDLRRKSAEFSSAGLPEEELNKKLAELAPQLSEAEKELSTMAMTLGAPPSDTYTRLTDVYPDASSGRRTALAQWIVGRNNPLAARVAVNHIWLRHFGAPLVSTVFDFGRNGQPPWNQAILDWMAVELLDSQWRMKPIHRLIVTSGAYRRSSAGASSSQEALDPDNIHLWRMPARRMEAEVVRDSALAVAGELDTTLGGPDLDPADGFVSPRRSLYFRTAKEKRVMFLSVFDSASVVECYRRQESVVPQQALAMVNSPLTVSLARRLAGKLAAANGPASSASPASSNDMSDMGDTPFVTAAYETILSRAPTAAELRLCQEFLQASTQRLGDAAQLHPAGGTVSADTPPATDPRQRAREGLVLVLLNHNDFVTVR